MDLSAVIFVVLALAWAVYLIPKALKHHDELASDRLVEGHSDKVRILSRKTRTTVVETTETAQAPAAAPVETPAPVPAVRPAPLVTRAAARKAAQRRRRVLGVLVLAFAVVWTLTWFAYLPFMTPAIPGALVVGWLVIARLSVRRQQRARRGTVAERSMVEASVVEPVETTTTPATTSHLVDRLTDEDTVGLDRQQLEEALADDGSLWDPLPMTLPTYVNKARARRTVRTIELTGINSSGHDQGDSALAREAQETAQEEKAGEAEERKVAGA